MNSTTTKTPNLALVALLALPVLLAAAQTPALGQDLVVPGSSCVQTDVFFGMPMYTCPVIQNPGVQIGGINLLSAIVGGDFTYARVCREHVFTGERACTDYQVQFGPGRHQTPVLLRPVLNPDNVYPTAFYTMELVVAPGAQVYGLHASNVPTGP